MRIGVSQKLSEILLHYLGTGLEGCEIYVENRIKNAFALSIARFIEPHLEINTVPDCPDERATEIFVLSTDQVIAICENVSSLIGICQTETAMAVVNQHLKRVQQILNADSLAEVPLHTDDIHFPQREQIKQQTDLNYHYECEQCQIELISCKHYRLDETGVKG